MADETSTATSEQTTEATETAQTEAVATETTETASTEAAETTALGGAGETAEAAAEAETEGTEAKVEVPETYELTPPEGFEKLDSAIVDAATPVFKDLGLSNEQANKLVPIAGELAKKIVADRDQQLLGNIAEQRATWLTDAKADPEIGGANWDASLTAGAKALDTLGFPKGSPLRNLLDESGLGNHPEMIRAFAKVGKAIGEDSDFVRSGQDAPVKKSDAELFYGSKT